MNEIISFKIDKFRNQFHIFGASNIIAFLVFSGALIFFPRFLMRKIMCNPEMVYLVGVIIFGIGINIAISRCSKEEMKFLVVLATHILAAAQKMCNRAVLMSDGTVVDEIESIKKIGSDYSSLEDFYFRKISKNSRMK